jgi:transcriptional regulator with XRE-family HTH domain
LTERGIGVYERMFKDNLRRAITSKGLVVKEAAALAGISKRTVDNWLSQNPTVPAADDAVRIATALGTTVEELVDDEAGRAYVAEWARRNISEWKPPPRLKTILDVAEKLADTDLKHLVEIAKTFVKDNELGAEPRTKVG